MISIWLPWFSISWGSSTFQDAGSASISGTTGHGWLWLEFIVALALLAYLAARAAWDRLPFTMPVAHAPLLIAGTSLQLLLVLIAFIDIPYGSDGVGWTWGAFIALLAALAAAGPVVGPRRPLLPRQPQGRGRRPPLLLGNCAPRKFCRTPISARGATSRLVRTPRAFAIWRPD